MSTVQSPEGMPELRRGRHTSPTEGACLMEYVSVLAGEPFSDHPACVDPLLVRLGWAVNDVSNDAVRAQLPDLAPRLVGTAAGGPQLAPLLVIACCGHARARLAPTTHQYLEAASARAQNRLRRVQKRLAAGRPVRGERTFRLRAEVTIDNVVRALAAQDAQQLPQLLRVVVEVAEVACRTPATHGVPLAPASSA